MYFGQTYFNLGHFGQEYWPGGGDQYIGGTVLVQVPWRFNRIPLTNTAFDYWVINSADQLVQSGTATTDGNGISSFTLPATYSGQSLLVVVNNIGPDMSTSGKFHGQAVVAIP